MKRKLLLDLFCKAGGASMGYYRAGFDVVGVDIEPQPHYPFKFFQADALEWIDGPLDADWDAVHASPPCHDHSKLRNATGRNHETGWLLGATRELLEQTGLPWVIENVPGAPMRADYNLCGCQFNLPGLRRPRWFETSWHGYAMRPPCSHTDQLVTVSGHGAQGWEYKKGRRTTQEDRRRAMGIDWMNRDELAQAIPPAFTEYIGTQLLQHMEAAA
jgi:DNA (cytosine-5)-methyltransferase 1